MGLVGPLVQSETQEGAGQQGVVFGPSTALGAHRSLRLTLSLFVSDPPHVCQQRPLGWSVHWSLLGPYASKRSR